MYCTNLHYEVWRPIPDYDGYEASNLGQIRSLSYRKTGKPGVLKPAKNNCGYEMVSLPNGKGGSRSKQVSRLVASAFFGPAPEGYEINHRNENRADNQLGNLEYVDRGTNIRWGTAPLRRSQSLKKPVNAFTLGGDFVARFDSLTDAAKTLGLHVSNLSTAIKEHRTCGGFRWKFSLIPNEQYKKLYEY